MKYFYDITDYKGILTGVIPRKRLYNLFKSTKEHLRPLRGRRLFVDGRLSEMAAYILETNKLVDAVYEGQLTNPADLNVERFQYAIVTYNKTSVANVTGTGGRADGYDLFIDAYVPFLQKGGRLLIQEPLWERQTRVITSELDTFPVDGVRNRVKSLIAALGGGTVEYLRENDANYWYLEPGNIASPFIGPWVVADPTEVGLDMPVGTWSERYYDNGDSDRTHISIFELTGNGEPLLPINRGVHYCYPAGYEGIHPEGFVVYKDIPGHCGIYWEEGTLNTVPKGKLLMLSGMFLGERTLTVGSPLESEIPNNFTNLAYFTELLKRFFDY